MSKLALSLVGLQYEAEGRGRGGEGERERIRNGTGLIWQLSYYWINEVLLFQRGIFITS